MYRGRVVLEVMLIQRRGELGIRHRICVCTRESQAQAADAATLHLEFCESDGELHGSLESEQRGEGAEKRNAVFDRMPSIFI